MKNKIVGSKTNEFINPMKKYGTKKGINKPLITLAIIIFIIINLLILFYIYMGFASFSITY